MINRHIRSRIKIALKDTPVVVICGPRQCGKTTLVKTFKENSRLYITLDEQNQLAQAKRDPIGFIRDIQSKYVIIDEIQRAPELLLAIKQDVDEAKQYGKYLLTGSSNIYSLPKLSDSLAGRMEVISLLPFSECEVRDVESTFLNKVLSGIVPSTKETRQKSVLLDKILSGGYPVPSYREEYTRKLAWHDQYLNSIVHKDVKDISQINHVTEFTKLMTALANQAGQLVNYNMLASIVGISRITLKKYINILQQLYIFEELPSWHKNNNKRLTKTPKIHVLDTGLLCALRRIEKNTLLNDTSLYGFFLESYVFCELKRLSTSFDSPLYFYHYRDKDKVEVDVVIETTAGDVIGVEIKSKASLRNDDFKGLLRLKELAGEHFKMGVLLYDGDHNISYEQDIIAMPISVLWC